MTVGELIKLLQMVNPDLEVIMEGCDCYQVPMGIYEDMDGISIVNRDTSLRRNPEEFRKILTTIAKNP